MSLGILAVNIVVGILFVLVWGVLSYIASSEAEFKSFFFGGLANFVFFIGGVLASYLSSLVTPAASSIGQQVIVPTPQQGAFSVIVALYIAIATICAVVALNLFAEGFTNSLGHLERLGTISFRSDGYRDIQIYAGGAFGILCFSAAWIYGLYLGSVRPGTTYVTVLAGVTMSLGIQGLLYLIFGIFFNSQVFQILDVSTPPVLETYSPLLKKLFGFGITFATVAFGTLTWTTLLWFSIKLGNMTRAMFLS